MKTPMQEVFAQLRASKDSNGFGEAYCVDWLLEMEKEILEKERDVITKTYDVALFYALQFVEDWGILDSDVRSMSRDYYNETFKTKER